MSFSNRIASAVYSHAAFPLLRRMFPVEQLVVYYHLVSDREVAHVNNLYAFRTVTQFKRDMEAILKVFRPISLQNVLDSLNGGQALVRNSLLLTFDDGLRECYEVIAPILSLNGIPATFFLCSGFVDNNELAYDHKKSLLSDVVTRGRLFSIQRKLVRAALERVGISQSSLIAGLLCVDYGRRQVLDEIANVLDYDFADYLRRSQPYLTSEQVTALLEMGHAVGAHSIDHPRYADVPLVEQVRQTVESVRFVKKRFALPYGAFSFPHSDASVSAEFFREMSLTGDVDIFFGNQGLLKDSVPRSFQRSSMEKSLMSAEGILGKMYARRFVKSVTGAGVVRRS